MSASNPETTSIAPAQHTDDHERIEAIGDQLRAKISSKFQATTFLAGFGLTILGIQLSILWQSANIPRLLPASIALTHFAILLYVYAIVKLDELTMPKRFWDTDLNRRDRAASRAAYLTDDDLWALQKRMVFYWTYVTLVATATVVVSLFLMLLPLWPPSVPVHYPQLLGETLVWLFVLGFFGVIYLGILGLLAQKNFKPLLRPND